MRNTLTIISFLFFSTFLMAQSNEWRVWGGIKTSSLRQGSQPFYITYEDYSRIVNAIQPIQLSTYSLVYSHKISTKWHLSLGLNYNKKGFKAIFYDSSPSVATSKINVIRDYWGFLIGTRYNIYQKNSWKMNIEILANPEFAKLELQDVKKFAVSSIALLNIEKQISGNFSIVLNPFFETSLMKYKSYTFDESFQYSPYGYGLMAGIKYSISK